MLGWILVIALVWFVVHYKRCATPPQVDCSPVGRPFLDELRRAGFRVKRFFPSGATCASCPPSAMPAE